MAPDPEQRARGPIERLLAPAGWRVQNLAAAGSDASLRLGAVPFAEPAAETPCWAGPPGSFPVRGIDAFCGRLPG
jgi:hypothetical protein